MAEADFGFLSNGLDAASVKRGVTAGFTPPNGGGTYVFGFNSQTTSPGAVGLHVGATNNPAFAPLEDDTPNPSGGSIRGALKRAVSAAPTGFAPFLFIGLQDVDVEDQGYLLGLSDNDPHEIVLRKGAPIGGLDPTSADILRIGSATFTPDAWHHLRLDMIVNPNGDVVLKCFQNDLSSNPVTAPVWTAIPGIADYVDDALGAASESDPFVGGYLGFGFQTSNLQRRALFDHIQPLRQK
jgi:hypothetical protein